MKQYEGAQRDWPFIHEVNAAHGMPRYLMHALGSRETNLTNIVGDGGNGFGVWQRDIQHGVPDTWMQDVRAQCEWSADLLRRNFRAAGTWERACNMYNSGQPETKGTAHQNYGPDVIARRDALERALGPTSGITGGIDGGEKIEAVESLLGIRSGLVVDVADQSQANRAPLRQSVATGRKNQSVIFEPDGGAVRIKFEHSGKYLDGDPARLEVVQFERAAVPWQLWKIDWVEPGWRIANAHSGHVLDIEGASTAPGARIIQFEWNGGPNQRFVRLRFR